VVAHTFDSISTQCLFRDVFITAQTTFFGGSTVGGSNSGASDTRDLGRGSFYQSLRLDWRFLLCIWTKKINYLWGWTTFSTSIVLDSVSIFTLRLNTCGSKAFKISHKGIVTSRDSMYKMFGKSLPFLWKNRVLHAFTFIIHQLPFKALAKGYMQAFM
jgi:hypothetical protein